ncbi:hypothetical protein GCM10027417_21820 [Glutamicibacter endophyticus]
MKFAGRIRNIATGMALCAALAGCSAPNLESPQSVSDSADLPASPAAVESSQESSPAATPAPDISQPENATTQEWADSKVKMWTDNSGIKSVKGFLGSFALINSWEATGPGEITLYLDNSYKYVNQGGNAWDTSLDELNGMARVMYESIGAESPELETIKFQTENGKHHGAFERARTGADPSDLDAWADEKYEQWINAMNFTYESLCGKITELPDYRKCIPTDPHAYINSVTAPAEGELLVTLSDGPWQNGTYDTQQIPGVSFVSSNMIIKINPRSQGDIEKLTVVTQDGKESNTALKENWSY